MPSTNDPRLLTSLDYSAFGLRIEDRVRDNNNDARTEIGIFVKALHDQNEEISASLELYLDEHARRARAAG